MRSSRPRFGLLALAALVLLPVTVVAGMTPAGDDMAPAETVVVTGRRPDPQTVEAVVSQFVQAHAQFSRKVGQLTRWQEPVCPEVRNLPAAFGKFIVTRILAIAASVGAPARTPCKPNIEIIFTAQPQLLMDRVAQKSPVFLGYHFVHDTDVLAKVVGPVQAWYVTATGNDLVSSIDSPYHGTPSGAAGSRFSHGLRSQFAHILIIANTDILAGRPIGPVADYIVMLALAQPGAADDCARLPSILDLFSAACADADKPQSLTIADKAYLEGLYAMQAGNVGALQRSSIQEHMERALEGR